MKKNTKARVRKAPLESVSVRDMTIPIYRKPVGKYDSYLVSFYSGGKRVQKRAPTLEKARAVAREAIRQITEGAGRALTTLSPDEVADYMTAVRTLRQHPGATLASAISEWSEAKTLLKGASLMAAASSHLRELGRQKMPTIKVSDLVAEFYLAKERAGLSPRYVAQLKKMLPKFKDAFRCDVAGVTTDDIQGFLNRLKMSNRSRENYRCAIASLFSYAKRRGYLPRDVATEAEHVEHIKSPDKAVGVYTAKQLRGAIDAATGVDQLAVAIGAFAGLRTSEMFSLCWQNIGKKHITIEAAKSKTRARRLVPILPALRAVLTRVDRGQPEDKVFPQARESFLSRVLTDAFRNSKTAPVNNGLRHSFCTYRLATTKDAGQTALEAGNSSTIIFKHYRELATPSQGTAWFGVRPSR
jgi:integrase